MKITLELTKQEVIQIRKKCMILGMVYDDRHEESPDATDAIIRKIGKTIGMKEEDD